LRQIFNISSIEVQIALSVEKPPFTGTAQPESRKRCSRFFYLQTLSQRLVVHQISIKKMRMGVLSKKSVLLRNRLVIKKLQLPGAMISR
jgi:hypothetical protein